MNLISQIHPFLVGFTSLSFLVYGATCIFSDYMKREFTRYGVPQFRVTIGTSQLAAAIGLALSYTYPLLGAISAAGLTLQMALGFGVRLKIRDGIRRSSPAFIYMVVSFLILIGY